MLAIGENLNERYRIERVLGEGGMGIVYLGSDLWAGRFVALKEIKTSSPDSLKYLEQVKKEVKALAKLNHANIVIFHDLVQWRNDWNIVMEYVEGEPLDLLLERRGPLPHSEALALFKQMLAALEHAHRAGVIHRDIKPGNVMLTPQGLVKVMDFGLARVEREIRLTQSTHLWGTLYYTPPEQLRTPPQIDARGDVYSAGMTLYEMLAGRLPFGAHETIYTLPKIIVEGKLAPPERYNPAVPPELSAIVMKAIANKPAKRYQSAEEIRAALEDFEAAQASSAPPSPRRRNSKPMMWSLVSVLVTTYFLSATQPGQRLLVWAGLLKSKSSGYLDTGAKKSDAGRDSAPTTRGAPEALTHAASNIVASAATLNAAVKPNGLSAIIKFEYGVTPRYGNTVTALPSTVTGVSAVSVSAAASRLLPNTIYHFRVVATNGDGATYGANQTFATSPSGNAFDDVNAGLVGVKRGAAAWGDYDNDNDLDVLLFGDGTDDDDSTKFVAKLYRNGGGIFMDTSAPLVKVTYAAMAWADYDDDGDLDILLTGTTTGLEDGATTRIYRNENDSFVETNASLLDVYFSGMAWGDYDNDGDLDLLLPGRRVGSTTPVAKIYRNESGTFLEDTQANLVGVERSSVAWGDYDNDGDLDILFAGRANPSPSLKTSIIYRNDEGSFTDIAAPLAKVDICANTWGDYDNDGDLDILLTGRVAPDNIVSEIYRNTGGVFSREAFSLTGLHQSSAAFGDYDNDGDFDILLAGNSVGGGQILRVTKIYQNHAGSFEETAVALPQVMESAAIWGDYDNDGDLDILLAGGAGAEPMSALFRNNSANTNTLPTAPSDLAASVNGNTVTLSWNKAADNQTPQAALTYNLRVGKTSGGGEIVPPMSDPVTGYRRVPLMGNTNHRNTWTLKNLPNGKYYWSVQAIDQAFAGSAFAQEESFIIRSNLATATSAPVVASFQ